MKRLLLLLPLLLLSPCKATELPKSLLKQTEKMLLKQSDDVRKDLVRLTERTRASSDPKAFQCANRGISIAYMERLGSIWDDIASLMKAQERWEDAKYAQKAVDAASQYVSDIKKDCEIVE